MISNVGISQIEIVIPDYFISLEELAKVRNLSPDYPHKGLGVIEARIPYNTSLLDLAAKAISKINLKDVERIYVGTESDPDASKPLSVKILNRKLGLNILPFQYKFACIGGLKALLSACEYVVAHDGKPAVVLAFDRSIYGEKDSRAEITQGCAAVALRVEENPKLLAIDYRNIGQYAADIDDFKVPAFSYPFPQVQGELTKPSFLLCQKRALEDWKKKNLDLLKEKEGGVIELAYFFILHTPFSKIVEWAAALFYKHEKLKEKTHLSLEQCLENPSLFKEYKEELDEIRRTEEFKTFFEKKFSAGLKYNPYIGNSYTCSIFVSLIGALQEAKKGQSIGISGYGAGAGSLCFGARVTLKNKFKSDLEEQIKRGKKLSVEEYFQWRKSNVSYS